MNINNANDRFVYAVRLIGPEIVSSILKNGPLAAHEMQEHYSKICSAKPGTFGKPTDKDVERYGRAAHVLAALYSAWREISAMTGKRDKIPRIAKALALAEGVNIEELTDLEFAARVYSTIVAEETLSGEFVEDFRQRRGKSYVEIARELRLKIQEERSTSTGLAYQRSNGINKQALLAFWNSVRDNLELEDEREMKIG